MSSSITPPGCVWRLRESVQRTGTNARLVSLEGARLDSTVRSEIMSALGTPYPQETEPSSHVE
jgi:hypothetical protein